MELKAFLIFSMVLSVCCLKTTRKKEKSFRDKRYIPYAGQTLQATYHILSHPIVAAALQKISMDAMATVASALKEVHQSEEKAKKTELMTKTLDKISKLKAPSLHQPMPMLHDSDAGSGSGELVGDDVDASGSGNEAADFVADAKVHNVTIKRSKVKKPTSHQYHNHHHHHHHHHHHPHHDKHEKLNKKSSTTKGKNDHKETELALKHINWEFIANNTSIVEKIAKDSHIPVKDLLQILHNGASRSDITKQAAAMLNKSIETQNDLSKIYNAEEKTPEEEEKDSSHLSKNTTLPVQQKIQAQKIPAKNQPLKVEKPKVTANKTALVIPKNIPDKCSNLVKQYSDGEMILMDYLKEMKICKKGEEVAKKLASTTPLQRVALATQDLIQQQAYMYALNSMRNSKPTVKEAAAAESIMDKWRSNSFGPKSVQPAKPGLIPNTVKLFMTQQAPANVAPLAVKPASTQLSVKNVISKDILQLSDSRTAKQDTKHDGKPEITKRRIIPNNLALFHKISLLNGEADQPLPQTGHESVFYLSPSKVLPEVLTRSNIPKPVQNNHYATDNSLIFNRFGFLEKKSLISGETPKVDKSDLKVPSPLPQQDITQRSYTALPNDKEAVSHVAPAFSSTHSLPQAETQSNSLLQVEPLKNSFIQSEPLESMLKIPSGTVLTNSEIAKEQFLASLANPAFRDIPVDGTLTAAIQRMSNFNLPMEDIKKNVELQKRDLISQKKTMINNRRDTLLKVQSDKAIERSKMSVPLVDTQQGPKLMDKIRDIGRIIATP